MLSFAVLRGFCAMGVAALVFADAAIAQENVLEGPVNVTFNVRMKVEGNVAAVDTGVDLECSAADGTRLGAVQRINVIPAGQTFVPETGDGFIARQVRFEGLYPNEANVKAGGTLQDISWSCRLINASTGADFVNPRTKAAVAPADIGSCTSVIDYIGADGVTKNTFAPSCAVARE